MRSPTSAALTIALSGCAVALGGCEPAKPDPTPATTTARDDSAKVKAECDRVGCDNVVNAVLVPKLVERGLDITLEDDHALCRRYAIDLTGLAPTPDEIAQHCEGKSPGEVIDYFMNKPSNAVAVDGSAPYVFVNRRGFFWGYGGGTLRYGVFYPYSHDLDAVVRQLFEGSIGYDTFARKVLSAPGFVKAYGKYEYADHLLSSLAAQAIRVFLGREALPAEAADFGNLWRGWASHFMSAADTVTLYPKCPQGDSFNCEHYEMGIDWSQCQGTAVIGCRSTVFGDAEYVPAEDLPKAGYPYDKDHSWPAFVRSSDLPASELAKMEVAGKVLVAQKEFAEAAVDRVLVKYLGWWRAGAYKPDFELPEARAALAKKLVADGYDIRKLEREVLGSLLYTQAARRERTANVPLWAFGPVKSINPVVWLDLVSGATGADYGVYDFRYGAYGGEDNFGSLPGKHSDTNRPERLGNIGDGIGVGSMSGRRALLQEVCQGAGVADGATPDQVIDAMFAGLGRPARPEERAAIRGALQNGDDGCKDLAACKPHDVAAALCRSLYASSLFAFY